MRRERANLEAAARVLVVGGGVVGTELAADIKFELPEKEVVLAQGNAQLLPRIAGAHAHVAPYLEKLGVQVHLNERVAPSIFFLLKFLIHFIQLFL